MDDEKPIIRSCHRCWKEFPLSKEQEVFMFENKIIFGSWVCPECWEKDDDEF